IGELRARADAVVRADAEPTLTREPVEQRARLLGLAAAMEPAAVQVDERGATGETGAVAVDVKQAPAPGIAVTDIRDALDVPAPRGEGREQDARERRPPAQTPRQSGLHR